MLFSCTVAVCWFFALILPVARCDVVTRGCTKAEHDFINVAVTDAQRSTERVLDAGLDSINGVGLLDKEDVHDLIERYFGNISKLDLRYVRSCLAY